MQIGCSSTSKKCSRNSFEEGSMNTGHFYGEDITPEQEKSLLETKVIYFEFDSFEVSDQQRLVILAHAKKMLGASHLRLRIDGHTDERGSAEYNIGLGERRAKAVVQLMATKGVSVDRMVTSSFGKEKPKDFGHDESAWQLNRRAELYYE